MATEQAQAEAAPQSTAAGESALPAGTQPAGQSSPEVASGGERSAADEFLASIGSSNDLLRLNGTIPPATSANSDVPVARTEEATLNPEDVAGLAKDAPLPKRLRIASLAEDRQRAILALSDPNRSMDEVFREFGSAAPAGGPPVPVTGEPRAGTAAAPASPATGAADINPGLPSAPAESVQGVRSQIAALRKEQIAALRAADMEGAADAQEQIAALEDSLPGIQQAESAHKTAFDKTWLSSERQSVALYPDLRDPNAQISREMARLEQQLKSTKDPLFFHPDKPMILASRAAVNLGIAPQLTNGTAARTAAPLKATPVAALTARAASPNGEAPAPAAGGARTAPPASAAVTTDALLAGVKDVNDVLRLTRF